jgi:uncharacterized lipoprotein YddW (UPF0748 family)
VISAKEISVLLTLLMFFLNSTVMPAETDQKTKMLWIDSEMGVFDVSDKAKVTALLDKCKQAGINSVAVDVKNYAGLGFYRSKIVPHVSTWDGKDYPADYDLLQTVLDEGHRRSIRVFAALNVFSEGLKKGRLGPVYAHREWETIVYDKACYVTSTTGGKQEVLAINERGANDGLSLFDRRYGAKIFKKDSPQNAIDGNVTSACSVWVSNDNGEKHFLEIALPSAVKIQKVKIVFVKGFIPRAYTITLNAGESIAASVSVKDNFLLSPEYDIAATALPRSIRIEFADCGFDRIARVREVQAFANDKGTLRNVCIGARISADSSMNRGNGEFIVMADSRVKEIYQEASLSPDGVDIPTTGCVVLADGRAKAWTNQHLARGDAVRLVTEKRLVGESDYGKGILVYVNPINPRVQERMLDIIKEILINYKIDGIILDRVRYDNFATDFSDISRKQFEQWLGKSVERFPEDIYELPDPLTGGEMIKGKYYRQWLEWRAKNIKDFMTTICATVRAFDKKVIVGDYVGGWYPDYWEVGVNWASARYDASADYAWATPTYCTAGYAEILDFLSPGLYYSYIAPEEARRNGVPEYSSIEGGIHMVKKVVGNSTKIITGLYYPNLYDKERFRKAVQLCLARTDGVMIFSHHYFAEDDTWEILKYALAR